MLPVADADGCGRLTLGSAGPRSDRKPRGRRYTGRRGSLPLDRRVTLAMEAPSSCGRARAPGALTRVRAARETRDVRRLIVAVALVCGASSIAPVGLARGQDAPPSADEEARVRFAAGRLAPLVSKTYPLAQAADALDDMMNRRVQGKLVLQV